MPFLNLTIELRVKTEFRIEIVYWKSRGNMCWATSRFLFNIVSYFVKFECLVEAPFYKTLAGSWVATLHPSFYHIFFKISSRCWWELSMQEWILLRHISEKDFTPGFQNCLTFLDLVRPFSIFNVCHYYSFDGFWVDCKPSTFKFCSRKKKQKIFLFFLRRMAFFLVAI